MVSIVYKPSPWLIMEEDAHNRLTSKNCAGTTLNDNASKLYQTLLLQL